MIVDEQPPSGAENIASAQEVMRRALYRRHRSMLILSASVLLVSSAFSVYGTGGEAVVTWLGIELPPLCGSRAFFGVECPGCGLTRSFIALTSGDFSESLRFHRIGWVMWLMVVLQIPFRSYSLWQLRTSVVERRWPTWVGYLLIAALMGNWVLKFFAL